MGAWVEERDKIRPRYFSVSAGIVTLQGTIVVAMHSFQDFLLQFQGGGYCKSLKS